MHELNKWLTVVENFQEGCWKVRKKFITCVSKIGIHVLSRSKWSFNEWRKLQMIPRNKYLIPKWSSRYSMSHLKRLGHLTKAWECLYDTWHAATWWTMSLEGTGLKPKSWCHVLSCFFSPYFASRVQESSSSTFFPFQPLSHSWGYWSHDMVCECCL